MKYLTLAVQKSMVINWIPHPCVLLNTGKSLSDSMSRDQRVHWPPLTNCWSHCYWQSVISRPQPTPVSIATQRKERGHFRPQMCSSFIITLVLSVSMLFWHYVSGQALCLPLVVMFSFFCIFFSLSSDMFSWRQTTHLL